MYRESQHTTEQAKVGSFATPLDAELARVFLESHGIACRLEDALLVGTALPLSAALGGVKLIVNAEDADSARGLLEAYHAEQRAVRAERETDDARAERALRSAVIGVVLLPVVLHVHSAWLLWKIRHARLSARARRRFRVAVLIDGVVLGLTLWLLVRAVMHQAQESPARSDSGERARTMELSPSPAQ